jgi:hypothetical protein
MQTSIHQFVKKNIYGHRQRVGILFGTKFNDKVYITHSLAAVKRGDKFDTERGFDIVRNRLFKIMGTGKGYDVPQSLKNDIEQFRVRCTKYFKQAPVN